MNRSEEIDELAAALARAQGQLAPAPKNGTAKIQSPKASYSYRFADLESVWEAARGPLSANGLAVVQLPEPNENGILLRTTLLHSSGQWVSSTLPLLFEGESMQAMGSAITFGRRYMLASMVGIVCEADDDGASAAGAARREGNGGDARPAPPRWGNRPADDAREAPRATTPGGAGGGGGGRALFKWAKGIDEVDGVGLLKYLSGWAKLQDFPGRMVEWSDDQVALARAEAQRKLRSLADRGDAFEEEEAVDAN